MKQVVSIDITKLSTKSERMSVKLDGTVRGIVDVACNEWPLIPALLMLGFDSVVLVDECGRESRFTTTDLLRSNPVFFDGQHAQSRGRVELRYRWSEPLEEYRIDVRRNGVRVPSSVEARLNFATLRVVLVQLGFSIGHIQELAQAA